jgi:hypothetical protein
MGLSAIVACRENHEWYVQASNATARKKAQQRLGQPRCNSTMSEWSRTTAMGSGPLVRAAKLRRANVSTRRGVQYRASSYSSPCRKILATVDPLSESPRVIVQTGCKHGLRDFWCSKEEASPSDGGQVANFREQRCSVIDACKQYGM